ncbi:MAG: PhzF family phenazine biosynthesis protein [Candidatus Magnetoovum sp. WYHC-5]|nr:PhzF family phenazine biosynthesis protein [Candidatus Magnetoovum sp. WYHC-5]
MDKIKIYHVDAFTNKRFSGNPAAVCPLPFWYDDTILQAIAAQNNLSETAFLVHENGEYTLRWFTPVKEVKLCGHATLAAACVLFTFFSANKQVVRFNTLSGLLTISKKKDFYSMDFPLYEPLPCDCPKALKDALKRTPKAVYKAEDYLAIFDNEEDIISLRPNFDKLKELDLRGVAVSAKGKAVDFVSRFFAPKYGINEDPVTGSAHCTLAPYWARVLGKTSLHALQLSKRGGEIFCSINNNRVIISGQAVIYLEGHIFV